LKKRDLPQNGLKAALAARLTEAVEAEDVSGCDSKAIRSNGRPERFKSTMAFVIPTSMCLVLHVKAQLAHNASELRSMDCPTA
jgi:hypothetical protein